MRLMQSIAILAMAAAAEARDGRHVAPDVGRAQTHVDWLFAPPVSRSATTFDPPRGARFARGGRAKWKRARRVRG
jgi:hypothetical protein